MTDSPKSRRWTSEALTRIYTVVAAKTEAERKRIDKATGACMDLRDFLARPATELVLLGLTEAMSLRVNAVRELAVEYAGARVEPGARFRSGADIWRAYDLRMRALRVEQFWAILLDGKNRVIREVMISQGSLTASLVHPREVFAPAIRESAGAILFIHNHPSGDSTPSVEDIEITRRLAAVADLVGIRILDHVVIGDGNYCSFLERGLMERAEPRSPGSVGEQVDDEGEAADAGPSFLSWSQEEVTKALADCSSMPPEEKDIIPGCIYSPAGFDAAVHGDDPRAGARVKVAEDKVVLLGLYLSEVNHSPTGFAWGYGGSGPSQLAYAILRRVTGNRPRSRRWYHDFKDEVVACWPQDSGWCVRTDLVLRWIDWKETNAAPDHGDSTGEAARAEAQHDGDADRVGEPAVGSPEWVSMMEDIDASAFGHDGSSPPRGGFSVGEGEPDEWEAGDAPAVVLHPKAAFRATGIPYGTYYAVDRSHRVLVVDEKGVTCALRIGTPPGLLSPRAGFGWGPEAKAPERESLAFSILLDATEDRAVSLALKEHFDDCVLSRIPSTSTWAILKEQVLLWVAASRKAPKGEGAA